MCGHAWSIGMLRADRWLHRRGGSKTPPQSR